MHYGLLLRNLKMHQKLIPYYDWQNFKSLQVQVFKCNKEQGRCGDQQHI